MGKNARRDAGKRTTRQIRTLEQWNAEQNKTLFKVKENTFIRTQKLFNREEIQSEPDVS